MCVPGMETLFASLTSSSIMSAQLAVQAASAVTSLVGGFVSASKTQAANEQNLAQTKANADQATTDSGQALIQRELQERASTARRTLAAKIKANDARSTANATSQSAGLSMAALLADYDRQYLSYNAAQMQQLGFTTQQIDSERKALEATAQSRINSVPVQTVNFPDPFLAAAEFGSSALNTITDFAVVDPMTGEYTWS